MNNGEPFQGADGLIAKGATFYLVANLKPNEDAYSSSPYYIFWKDHCTTVNITINRLSDATYGLPNLEIPRPTLGLTIDLQWEEGLWFPEIPIGI